MIAASAPRAALSEAALATRGSGIRLAAELGGRAFALATSLLLAAGLGVEAFGVFAAVSSLAVLLAEVGEVGLQQTASRALVAGTLGLRAMARARLALFGALLLLALVAPPALALVGAFGGSAGASALLAPLILYFGLGGWSEFLGVALRARGHRVAEALVLLTLRAATLVAVVAALRAGVSLAGLGWAHVAAAAAPLLLAVALTRRAYRGSVAEAPAGIGTVLRTSLPLAVNAALALAALRVELLVVFWVRGSWEAGLFGAALKIVESLNAVPTAVAAGAMPALTREAIAGGRGRASAVRARTAATAALLAVPAAAGLALLAPGVLRILGADYVAAAPALRILAFVVIALFMNVVLLHALIAAGRSAWLPRLTGTRVALAAALALAFVPRWGMVAAAAGFLAAELLLLGLSARACRRAGFAVPLGGSLGVAAAASLPMAAAVRALSAGPLASAVIGAAVYAATLALGWMLLRGHLVRVLGAGEAS